MRTSVKRGVLIVGAGLGLLLVFLPVTYAIVAHLIGSSITRDVVTPDILAPEPPRAGDTTMDRLLELAGALDWPHDDGCKSGVDVEGQSEACRSVVVRNAELIVRLAAWAEDPGPLGPRQHEELGNHARSPVAVGITVELPPLMPTMQLADLLAIEAELAFRDGDCTAGERTLRLLFDLGAYFEQNPANLLHEMVGVALTNKATATATRVVPGASADAVLAWLPSPDVRLRSLQMGLGSEWLNMTTFLDKEMRQGPGPFDDESGTGSPMTWAMAEATGLYDPVHTRQMHDAFWKDVQVRTQEPPLNAEIEIPGWPGMGWVRFFHNPMGRMLFSIATPDYMRFARKAGLSMDRTAALRVALSARSAYARDGQWPAALAAIGQAEPVSAMNGKPLTWEDEAKGLRLFDEESDAPCEGDDDECLLPLVPPVEVSCRGDP